MNDQMQWREQTIDRLEALDRRGLVEMFHGHIPGIRIPALLSPEECARATARIKSARVGRKYAGALNIGTPLEIPSHWELVYTEENEAAWFTYFRRVGCFTKQRKKIFAGMLDPLDQITLSLGRAWGAPVKRVRHPIYGWRLYAGLIRSGAPRLHFDWAPFDLGLGDLILQAGANLYLSNFAHGGDLRMYRRYGMDLGAHAASGAQVIGNYDLPRVMIEGAESATIECGVGDFIVCPNRFLHEVTPGDEPEENRLVLSFHIGLMTDGTLAVFS